MACAISFILSRSYKLPIADNTYSTPATPAVNPEDSKQAFNQPVTLHLKDKVVFSDGLTVTLKEINDSRCPDKPGVECIWQGELAGIFIISGPNISNLQGLEVRLGMVRNSSSTLEGYKFTLRDATTSSMTIAVSKN